MVVHPWHFAVLAAVAVLIGWSLRGAPRPTLAGLAVALLLISGWLLHTLVLDEEFVDSGPGTVAMIAVPALLGVGLGVLALRGRRQSAIQ